MKWFMENFLPSFSTCDKKRISDKQADIFMRYLDRVGLDGSIIKDKYLEDGRHARHFVGIVDGKEIKLTGHVEWSSKKGGKSFKEEKFYLTIN